ncbi:DUF4166 domain-containing protein [Denitrobaculum tricleocarpae]|uniref:DUF4166 domain-containing protein n=1 Tax=Denitrobaculum tricleocarpae TaxID=2591009 RepID=A0A545TQU3_9PROT|nr:DUF4166 domain-containing protein [Denitrobaculum tricleocarpae]TQV79594.1 DUF4166 domain-containing protein [Denitrobaculum tricleocarpae]
MDAGSLIQPALERKARPAWAARFARSLSRKPSRQSGVAPSGSVKQDFAALVGPEGWLRLSPLIRSRFACSAGMKDITYEGTMKSVRCSRTGYLLAQLCRLFGTPLAPFEGRDIPIEVQVHDDPEKGGVAWDRIYFFPGRKPITVTSTKVFTGDGKMLLECVGGGFGMRLKVFEQDRKLHFRSESYFWRFAGLTVRLPDWLTPGVAHVVHSDLGSGWFRFEMTMRHRHLGESFYQDGTFKEKE